jgi:hypothetical protein
MEANQEPRWQDKIITYGCLIKSFSLSAAIILITAAIIVLILHLGGEAWSRGLVSIFAGLGLLLAFLQWAFPYLLLILSLFILPPQIASKHITR